MGDSGLKEERLVEEETLNEKSTDDTNQAEVEEVIQEDSEVFEETESFDESDSSNENGSSETKEKKKSLFKKDKKKDKKDQQIEELNDRLLRNMAEFENFRKRTEREKAQMFEMGAKDIIEKVIPVIDNFERGLKSISDEEKETAFAKGIEAIYKQMMTTLEGAGVKQIEAVGQPFDPNYHNAVMHIEDENFGDSEVAEEFQKGYLYRDTVVRHSMVKVAN